MGTSQSRTTTDGSSATVDRLKRYSRADLKSPLKAFGRQQQAKDSVAASAGHGGTKPGGTESTPASDYETPIYETSQRKPAVPVRCTYLLYMWLCFRTQNLLVLTPSSLAPINSTTSTVSVNAFHGSLRGRLLRVFVGSRGR